MRVRLITDTEIAETEVVDARPTVVLRLGRVFIREEGNDAVTENGLIFAFREAGRGDYIHIPDEAEMVRVWPA